MDCFNVDMKFLADSVGGDMFRVILRLLLSQVRGTKDYLITAELSTDFAPRVDQTTDRNIQI